MSIDWIRQDDYDAMCRTAAAALADAIARGLAGARPMLLGLATGNTMLGVYARLAALLNARRLDLGRLCTLNLDEYVDDAGRWVAADHPLSYRAYMRRQFFDLLDPQLGMRAENIHFPHPTCPIETDAFVARMRQIDMQLLGIGFNGHIAFNEPAAAGAISTDCFAELPTRIIALDERTIETNARLTAHGDRAQVPRRAVTLGMKPILAAREILLLACFAEQAVPLRTIRAGRPTPELPASYLLAHPRAKILYTGDTIDLESAEV